MGFLKSVTLILFFITSLSYGRECSPIPKDKAKLPTSLEKEIKAIANLCNLKTYEQKIRSLERSLKNLERCIPHYEYISDHQYMISSGFDTISFLYDNLHMKAYWKSVFNNKNIPNIKKNDILDTYLFYRAVGYGIHSNDATDPNKAYTTFKYDWEHDVYRGFYCVNYIKPPPPYKRTTN